MKHIMRLAETHDNTEVWECTVCKHIIEVSSETGVPHPSNEGDLTVTHVIVRNTGLEELDFHIGDE